MSDAEEELATVLRWAKVPEPVREYAFAPPRKWRFDFAWPDLRIAVEVDGGSWTAGRHTRGAGYERDIEKQNAALLAGWQVLRFTPRMVSDGVALRDIERLVYARSGGLG